MYKVQVSNIKGSSFQLAHPEQSGQRNFANYLKPEICGYNQKGSLAQLSNLVKKLQKYPVT